MRKGVSKVIECKLNRLIDSTLLLVVIMKESVEKLCREAVEYNLKTVALPPCWAAYSAELLKGSQVGITVPVGFPFGYSTTETKVAETLDAVSNGAMEIDMVVNVSYVKNKMYTEIQSEVNRVVEAASGRTVKVIIETCYLTPDEKTKLAKLIAETDAAFIKTSTGFGPSGSTAEDIRLLKNAVGDSIRIKAAGGIRTLDQAINAIEAGASRIGTSNAVEIMKTYEARISRRG